METQKEAMEILGMTLCPAFSVKDNLITAVNPAAQGLLLQPGADIRQLLRTGKEEYAAFREGCLYLTLNITANGLGATVVRRDDADYFLLEPETEDSVLRALSLAATQLRSPLADAMADMNLLPEPEDPASQARLARLNRALYRMQRILCNMSDSDTWPNQDHQQIRNIQSVCAGIFEKAQALLAQNGCSLTYEGLASPVYTLLDEVQLERAVLNMLSNALKFRREHSALHAKLSLRGRMLVLSLQDNGSGIAEQLRSTVFSRYLRQPGHEDSRFGLGLGMVLIRSAAAAHGGTVLIDQPEGIGTRITMTLAIRQGEAQLRSPFLRADYGGERDHCLLELAEFLPAELYQK